MGRGIERGSGELVLPPGERIGLTVGQTEVVVLPHGAMIAGFSVGGIDVLFPDQMIGPKRRGGIPFLFPNAGPLIGDQASLGSNLDQHGFARDMPWDVMNQTLEVGGEGVILALEATTETYRQFPYHFGAVMQVLVQHSRLRAEAMLINQSEESEEPEGQRGSEEPMPAAPGWHPYFFVPIGRRSDIRTNIPGFDPASYDWKSPQPFPGQEQIELWVPGQGTTIMGVSSHFKILMVWAVLDLPFLCFEPWVGPVNALLDPEQRLNIPLGGAEQLWMEIQFQPE